MLYYWLHIAYVFISSKLFRKRVAVNAPIVRKRMVNFFDCEGFRFMSNNRYMSYMDFIRFEIMFRSKLYDATVKKGMTPVLGSQKLIYKKPLKLGEFFKVTLINEGWDDKYVYHRHIFTRYNELYAIGYTKAAFWKDKQIQNMPNIIKECGISDLVNPPSHEVVNIFNEDYELLNSGKAYNKIAQSTHKIATIH